MYLRSYKSKYGDIGTPYYIGKGTGPRAFKKNQKEIKPPVNKNYIQIICKNMREITSLELEIFLIQLYGRIDLGTGCLRNRTSGGDGSSGSIHKRNPSAATKQAAKVCRGKIWVRHTDGNLEKRIFKNELDYYLNQGYELGRTIVTEKTRKLQSKRVKGTMWITNTKTLKTKMIQENEFLKFKLLGYTKGRIRPNSVNAKGQFIKRLR
jgi:hypothetical protein